METGIKKGRACKLVYTSSEPKRDAREQALRHERSEVITCYIALALLTVFGGPGLAVPVYGDWGWVITGAGLLGCVALLFYLARLDSDLHLLTETRGTKAPRTSKRPFDKPAMKAVPLMPQPYPYTQHHGAWRMTATPALARVRPIDSVKRWPYRRQGH
jgi:hypothetical protein